MKTILASLLLLTASFTLHAQQLITATVTVTNTSGTANGNTITINGSTRTFTNSVGNPSTQILTGANITAAASNLFLAYASVRSTGMDVYTSSTNMVIFRGFVNSAVSISLAGNWGTVSFSTNTLTAATAVRVPMSAVGNYERTNVGNGLVAYLSDSSVTSSIPVSATALANYMDLSTVQAVTGAKTFSSISGTLGNMTNGNFVNPSFTNGQNFGNPFRSPGTGTAAEQFGTGAYAYGNYTLAIGYQAQATNHFSTALGANAICQSTGGVAVGNLAGALGQNSIAIDNATAFADYAVAIGWSAQAEKPASIAIGQGSDAAGTNSVAIGISAVASRDNEIALGSVSHFAHIYGGLQVDGSITNTHLIGTNTIDGSIGILRHEVGSLIAGNNVLNSGTNGFLNLSGMSGDFTIAAINGAYPGKILKLRNTNGFNMIIAYESGFDGSTTTNRIRTGTGASITITNNPGFVILSYDGVDQRWNVETRSN